MVTKICHLTSAHLSNDIRIFYKECKTLQQTGFDVTLIAQHIKDEVVDEIKIIAIPTPANRKQRMTKTVRLVYNKALEVDADIYHLHDPELTRVGLWLKFKGKKVIYDAHEDLPRQIISKEWIPGLTRVMVSRVAENIENFAARKFDAIVCATPHITERFKKINKKVVNVNNYPILQELFIPKVVWSDKEEAVCYLGGISRIRGIYEMVEAIGKTNIKLLLGGSFESKYERKRSAEIYGWQNIDELGQINREDVKNILSRAIAGLVVLHPVVNYIDALPIKMFEYMSAGIPVIASDFPLWKEIVEGNQCGICVNPLDAQLIAEAIDWIVNHPKEAEQMGLNGRDAVKEMYNWENEALKLIQLYHSL